MDGQYRRRRTTAGRLRLLCQREREAVSPLISCSLRTSAAWLVGLPVGFCIAVAKRERGLEVMRLLGVRER